MIFHLKRELRLQYLTTLLSQNMNSKSTFAKDDMKWQIKGERHFGPVLERTNCKWKKRLFKNW